MYGAFLIDPTFWSRIGFLISYVATSLIALEVLRLVYTDANKRDVEKFLESYSKQRAASASPSRGRRYEENRSKLDKKEVISVNIEELEMGRPVTPPEMSGQGRHVRTAAAPVAVPVATAAPTPESAEKSERRKRATSSASQAQAQRTASPTPIRKLRKRSDTLTSTGSAESKRVSRRHREASPASDASSRHGSPRPRSREDRKLSGLGLGKLMRGKV
jgi:hypothetical protein